jgi:hypothetical protein
MQGLELEADEEVSVDVSPIIEFLLSLKIVFHSLTHSKRELSQSLARDLRRVTESPLWSVLRCGAGGFIAVQSSNAGLLEGFGNAIFEYQK